MKVMIVGAGKLGYRLAEAMNNENIDVTLVDVNPKTLERVNDHLDVLTIKANGIEITKLKELNINTYDLLVAATNSDETNTLICTLAKKLDCKRTIARIRDPEFIEQLDFVKTEMGVDYIINPDLTTATEIERYLSRTYNFYPGDFAKGKVFMLDFHLGAAHDFVEKRLSELKGLEGFLITAISRGGELIIPDGSTKLIAGDIIHVMGKSKDISKLAEGIGISMIKRESKKVVILGGSNIGYYLAKSLEKANINATIIEKDKARCQYLAEKLSRTMIIYGDGADLDLLEEIGLSSYDTFVGATGFDEQNLLMALVAKQFGVYKAIAKISRPNYALIVDKLDIDIALNPVDITVSNVLKFIRGGKVVSVSLLLGGEAEVTEVVASKDMPIVGKPLSQLGLQKGIIIGAIVHKGEVIIPDGNSIINENDRIIVFSLTPYMPAFNRMIRPNKGGILNGLRLGN